MFMHGSRKFCQGGGSNFDMVSFLVDEGRENPNTTISRPSDGPASKTPFKWCFAGLLVMAQH